MSVEIELKFQVPAQRLAALRRALATPGARREPMAARYFDTDAQHLAAARVALRLRREGRRWVQTLKCEADARADAGPLLRLEHNVPVPGAKATLDLARHAGTEAGERLARALSAAVGADGVAPVLQERYATELNRITRVLRHQGATVELALDVGKLHAQGRQAPICELEFELLDGPPAGLLALAARWAARFGLVLDLRSKSERGSLLAVGQAASAPVLAAAPALRRHMDLRQALPCMLRSTLAQVLPNASALLGGADLPEHLHQLRVGLRRLRSLGRLFGAAWPALEAALADPALARLWQPLGAARDRDVLAAVLQPAAEGAAAPAPGWVSAVVGPPAAPCGDAMTAPELQQLWLRLLGLAMGAPEIVRPEREPLPDGQPDGKTDSKPDSKPDSERVREPEALAALWPPLKALHRRVRRDAARFEQLDDAACHRLRRRIKRLRYGLELVSALLPRRRLARWLGRLRAAQDALGECNDARLALQACRRLVAQEPRAWFAIGWLAAREPVLRAAAAEAVRPLARRVRVRGSRSTL